MLKEILENINENLGLKNVEEGEIITPIDSFIGGSIYSDKDLTKRIKGIIKFKDGDIFEIQVVTPQEYVAYVKNKDLYIVLQKNDLSEFKEL